MKQQEGGSSMHSTTEVNSVQAWVQGLLQGERGGPREEYDQPIRAGQQVPQLQSTDCNSGLSQRPGTASPLFSPAALHTGDAY